MNFLAAFLTLTFRSGKGAEDANLEEVRSDEEQSDELPALALETKSTNAPTFVQYVPPP